MPDPITTTVEVEGEEREVKVDPSEHGYVPEGELQDRISKAVSNATKGRYALDEIPESDEVLDRLAESDETLERLRERRPDLFRNGRPDEGDDPDTGKLEEKLEEHRKAWESKHLKPVQKEKDQLESHVEKLTRDRIDRDFLTAFQEVGVRSDKGTQDAIRGYYLGVRDGGVQYSPEHDETFLTDESGDFIPSGDGDQPFLTIQADLAAKRENEEYGSWFADDTRAGTDFGQPGTGEATGGWRSKGKMEMADAEKSQAIDALISEYGRTDGMQRWEDWPLKKG